MKMERKKPSTNNIVPTMHPSSIPVKNKITEEALYKISRMKEVIKPTRPHRHDGYMELILLWEGAGAHQVDEHTWEVVPPCLFLLRPGQVHCWDFSRIPKGFVLIFKPVFMAHFWPSNRVLADLPSYWLLSERDGAFLRALMSEFEQAAHLPTPPAEYLQSLINTMILALRQSSPTVAPSGDPDRQLVEKYRQLIGQHFPQKRTVKAYADLLNTYPKKLNRVCQQVLKRGALEVIQETAVQEAKRLLAFTQMSISEIAFELQFNDPSYFVKFFKTHTNLTPGEFRQKMSTE